MSDNSADDRSRRTVLKNAAVAPVGLSVKNPIDDLLEVDPEPTEKYVTETVGENGFDPELRRQMIDNDVPVPTVSTADDDGIAPLDKQPEEDPGSIFWNRTVELEKTVWPGVRLASGQVYAELHDPGVVDINENDYYLGWLWGTAGGIDNVIGHGGLQELSGNVAILEDNIEMLHFNPTGTRFAHEDEIEVRLGAEGYVDGQAGEVGAYAEVRGTYTLASDRVMPDHDRLSRCLHPCFGMIWESDTHFRHSIGFNGAVRFKNTGDQDPTDFEMSIGGVLDATNT